MTLKPSQYILDSSREYSVYVADTRGIPNVVDGLKTSQRIALWLMRNRAEKIKTVGLMGQMAYERLYVHGDQSAANAISLLAAPFKNNYPLIQGEGEFGSRIKPDGIGAPRYTEVKRSKVAQSLLYTDLPNVPLIKNYDGSNQMPQHFLPLVPTVLLNGVVGVAVGYSTNILPRSLKDVTQACIDTVQGKKPKPIHPYYETYDVKVKNLGPSQYEFSGKAEIVDTSTVRVTELPPGLSLDDFRKRLIQMEEDEKILDFDDNSSETIDISIRMKRGSLKAQAAKTETVAGKKVRVAAKPAWDEQKAIDFFKIKTKVTERIVVLMWDQRRIDTYEDPRDLIADFVQFRLGVYEERYKRLLAEDTDELLYWKLLEALFTKGFTKKLGTFATKDALIAEVLKVAKAAKIAVGDHHVDRAISLATYRWTKDFEKEVKAKIAELEKNIKEYKAILKSKQRIKDIYVSELEAIKADMKKLIA